MSEATNNTPAPNAAPEPAPASPPAGANAHPELAALRDELAAIRAELAELAKAKPAAPAVPATDTPPPAITPKAPDTSALPIHARLAAGYSK